MTTRRVHPSPIGDLTLIAGPDGLVAVLWPDDADADADAGAGAARHDDGGPGEVAVAAVLDRAAAQLDEYFAGARTDFDLPLAPVGTPFQLAAWGVLRTIPFGSTISYGEQAHAMGDRRKARAVGAANGRNPLPIVVPCHRVRGADGALTGFAGGVELKAWLLDHERRVLVGNVGGRSTR